MNPLVARSNRKLEEALFFLERLRDSQGAQPTFEYYLSAFLSAWRSVGFVLQADLRRHFGGEFDAWWDAAKALLPEPRIPFSVLAELRNQALKEGETLPGMQVVVSVDHPKIEQVTYTVLVQRGQGQVVGEYYQFHGGAWPPIPASGFDDKSEFRDAFYQLFPMIRSAIELVDTGEVPFEVSNVGYVVDHRYQALSFEELVDSFDEHLSATRALLEEADLRFRL